MSCTNFEFKPVQKGLMGTNLGGWLNLEGWMFDGGKSLPPDLTVDQYNSFMGQYLNRGWSSEGDLVNILQWKLGTESGGNFKQAVKYFKDFRNSYITESDIYSMSLLGITKLRVPVGWWAFSPIPIDDEKGVIIDPYYNENTQNPRYYVPVEKQLWDNLFTWCKRWGVTLMIDLHSFPGGATISSYNGIDPNKPIFWEHENQDHYGLETWKNLLKWYDNLSQDNKNIISGFQPMNEMGLGLEGEYENFNDLIKNWLSDVVNEYVKYDINKMPPLYINFISSRGEKLFDFGNDVMQMLAGKIGENSKEKLYFDYHLYGCFSGHDQNTMASYIKDKVNEIKSLSNDKYNVSSTEWSLCLPKDAPNNEEIRKKMLEEQLQAFVDVQCENYFWTWKMPHGPKNEWSLQCITGVNAKPPSSDSSSKCKTLMWFLLITGLISLFLLLVVLYRKRRQRLLRYNTT